MLFKFSAWKNKIEHLCKLEQFSSIYYQNIIYNHTIVIIAMPTVSQYKKDAKTAQNMKNGSNGRFFKIDMLWKFDDNSRTIH